MNARRVGGMNHLVAFIRRTFGLFNQIPGSIIKFHSEPAVRAIYVDWCFRH
jgi:hypothetical protein